MIFIFVNFAVAAPLPIEAFGKLPTAEQVILSPDGSQIAFLRNNNGKTILGVTNFTTGKSKSVLWTDNEKFKIRWHKWANNNLLLIAADYPVQLRRTKYTESRLLKVKSDGTGELKSVILPKRNELNPQFQTNIIDMLPDDENHILMSLSLKKNNLPGVYKIDLTTSKVREIIYGAKSDIHNWMTDRQHRVRLGYGRDDSKIFYRLLDIQTNKWRNIWEYEIFESPDISPLGFGLNPNHLYIRALFEDRYAIYRVDLSKVDLPRELVYSDKNYDIEGALIYSKKDNDVIGVYHGEANNSKIFFKPKYAAFQKALNKAIPNAYNNVSSMSNNEKRYILFTSSPDSPGAFYLGDRNKKSLDFLFDEYPLLVKQKLSSKRKITYQARDGLNIEGYVTLPHGGIKKNNVALIIPHGGPMSRNYGGFDWFSQFFASRGYTILEPNFRGSSGYGFKFEMQSVKKWGGKMQDDLEDAAKWLAENYSINNEKICILGASYGGYAALMAAVRQQQTFRCAGSLAGVSDLEYVVRKARNFTNYDVVKKQIGDDFDLLEKQSPLNYANKITIPVLLVHGNKDRVVDVTHSRKMYKALKNNDKVVEYLELENGNHYLEIEENRLKTLHAFDAFLNKHLMQ
jgi:dipeptidyl aminopeptidase/acylaminoacyl peptidase